MCTRIPRGSSSEESDRENASCACFEAVYGPLEPAATVPATETTFTTSEGAAASSARQEGAQAPDAAEVVRARHLLDPLRREAQEAAAARDAGVVDEQRDAGVALHDRGGRPLDRLAVADVAELPLGAELLGERPQALFAARDQDAVPAAPAQGSRHRGPDPARAAGDDR